MHQKVIGIVCKDRYNFKKYMLMNFGSDPTLRVNEIKGHIEVNGMIYLAITEIRNIRGVQFDDVIDIDSHESNRDLLEAAKQRIVKRK